jgi:tetratricopeptide (TPR) repeat protein
MNKEMKKEDEKSVLLRNHERIEQLLNERRLSDTFVCFAESMNVYACYEAEKRLEELKNTYESMFRYFRENQQDQGREKRYLDLIRQAYEVNDLLVDHLALEHWDCFDYKPEDFTKIYDRMDVVGWLRIHKEHLPMFQQSLQRHEMEDAMISMFKTHDLVLNEFFQRICKTNLMDEEMLEALYRCLAGECSKEDMGLLVAGVTLSGLRFYDTKKVIFLLDAYSEGDPEVSMRGLTGALLILKRYDARYATEPEELRGRLEDLNRKKLFREDVCCVHSRLLQSLETGEVERTMNAQISESMNAMMKEAGGKIPLDAEKSNQLASRIPISRKFMKSMAQFQEEGYDVNLASFRGLKKMPFFDRMLSSWLIPFTPFSEVIYMLLYHLSDDMRESSLRMVAKQGFCESDKYSFLFMMASMYHSGMKQSPFPKSEEMVPDRRSKAEKRDDAVRFYSHDLYRFARIHVHREYYRFPSSLEEYHFTECAAFPWMKKEVGYLLDLAENYYDAFNYEEALYYYQMAVKAPDFMTLELEEQVETYIRLAECQEDVEDFEAAVRTLQTVERMQPNNESMLYHMITCYRRWERFDAALIYVDKLNEIEGNEENVLMTKALIYMHPKVHRMKDALKALHEVEYYHPGKSNILRAIGWCYFLLGDLEKAGKYIDRLAKDKKSLRHLDYLNIGHVEWCRGHFDRAVELYLKAEELSDSFDEFVEELEKDTDALIKNGISLTDIRLMRDTILEKLRSKEGPKKNER